METGAKGKQEPTKNEQQDFGEVPEVLGTIISVVQSSVDSTLVIDTRRTSEPKLKLVVYWQEKVLCRSVGSHHSIFVDVDSWSTVVLLYYCIFASELLMHASRALWQGTVPKATKTDSVSAQLNSLMFINSICHSSS